MLNSGPYKLGEEYTDLQLTKQRWFSMSSEKTWQTEDDDQEHQNEEQRATCLSIIAEDANLSTVPTQQVKHVFRKAQSLLSKENGVVTAPGSNGTAFMVESQTSKRPHYVTTELKGKIVCENCPGWASSKLCGHAVAIAEKLGKLEIIFSGLDGEISP